MIHGCQLPIFVLVGEHVLLRLLLYCCFVVLFWSPDSGGRRYAIFAPFMCRTNRKVSTDVHHMGHHMRARLRMGAD